MKNYRPVPSIVPATRRVERPQNGPSHSILLFIWHATIYDLHVIQNDKIKSISLQKLLISVHSEFCVLRYSVLWKDS